MNHHPGRDQSQTPLFPACLEDYVTPENPVRSHDNFVASLDVAILVFAAAAAYSVPAVPPPNLDIARRLCRWTNGGSPG